MKIPVLFILLSFLVFLPVHSQQFRLNPDLGYFENHGVNVMAFDDIYPEGHQSGVSIIMHGNRVATNGDIRFEPTPGQWQPLPRQGNRDMNPGANTITTALSFPDSARHLRGFNPLIFPDYVFNYTVQVRGEGASVVVSVDLDRPVPANLQGRVNFILELFPGALFGKPWIMDNSHGIFPEHPNGPTLSRRPIIEHTGDFVVPGPRPIADINHLADNSSGYNPIIADDIIAYPYAVGRRFTVRPDDPYNRFTVESRTADIKLYDGRMNHNNGWFVICSEVPAGATTGAIQWVITPTIVDDWIYKPVVQTSQVGYHPNQPKIITIELDKRETRRERPTLYRITETGPQQVYASAGREWGQFLRYNYLMFDFTHVKEEGLYQVRYGSSQSSIFRIARDIYNRGVWQPVLEYFLPVQMCHMRVSDKYRIWHGLCHMDDARMAPINFNHIDGYVQGPSTLTKYNPGDVVPGLNIGGWHDAGDDDLRVESQSGEIYILAQIYETFNVNWDETTICQHTRICEIHQPDGKNDLLQQIEHGLLSVVGAYRALGRLYRGIISNTLRQYVLLGDISTATDNILGNDDDRWVFTENNPSRELRTAANLAAGARVMIGFNDTLAVQTLQAARELFDITPVEIPQAQPGGGPQRGAGVRTQKLHAAVELFLTTSEQKYKDYILSETDFIISSISQVAWYVARAEKKMNDANFSRAFRAALPAVKESFETQGAETPYGVPYRPQVWGAGWNIQSFGYRYYFLHEAYPDIFGPDIIYNALDFILGRHPGSNTQSFASGVGAKSVTVGYGHNRADWYYIPGGVSSGTALIRPDFPELLVFPYLWQQVEYVMGGGSSHYMFLVLAAQKMLGENQ